MTKVTVLKEKLSTKENEVFGKWLTEDRMRKSGDFSPASIRAIVTYCKKFPEALVRPQWYIYSMGACFIRFIVLITSRLFYTCVDRSEVTPIIVYIDIHV